MDTQQVEVVGRSILEAALVTEGFEVARPSRDKHVDLLVYSTSTWQAAPIQMKASSKSRFSLGSKYKGVRRLVFAYIWLDSQSVFLLDYGEAFAFLGSATKTKSWTEKGYYTLPHVSEERMRILKQFENRWQWLRGRLEYSRP